MASESLLALLRRETRVWHARVEKAGMIDRLIRRQISKQEYCLLIRNLFVIYESLEGALLDHRRSPSIAPLMMPTLFRREKLAQDLVVLQGTAWALELAVTDSARAYADRLAGIASAQPELLVAHAYVRYLGDLSGGQILRGSIAQLFDLETGEGVRFYDFGSADEAATLAQTLREAIVGIGQVVEDWSAIADEARMAFEMHERLAIELVQAG